MIGRHIGALIALSLMTLAQPAAAADPPKQKITITHGGDALHYFPMYVARGAGFFAEEGLDVDWVNVNSGTRQAASVMGGSAEFTTLALLHVIRAGSEGGSLVALSSIFDVYAMTVVLSKDAIAKVGITPTMAIDDKVMRLKGLNLGISSPGSSTDALIRSLFLARHMDPDSMVKLQPFGTGTAILAAFEKQLTDGFIYVAPVPELAEMRGLGSAVINPFSGEVPELNGVPYVVLATSRDLLTTKPELVAATVRAVTKAMRFVQEKPEESKKIMRQYFADIDPTAFDLAEATYRKGSPKTPVITREQIDKATAWMNLGVAKPISARYEDIVAPAAAQAALASLPKQ
jgi:NitT/TauT family transport system substrate-binding protein